MKNSKINITTVLLLITLFAISTIIRLPNINRPLGANHEWLTAHTLRVQQIWYEEGAWKHKFNPIMNFGNPTDKNIDNTHTSPQISDEHGDFYYISYPPFVYILPYLIFKLFSIYPDVLPLQIFNLVIQLISAFFIFLIVRDLTKKYYLDRLNYPAILGFIIYTFSSATLWLHSNAFFADMLIQPLFIIGIYIFQKITTKEQVGNLDYWLLGLTTFLMIYTEWLGVLFAFSIFIYCLFDIKKPGSKKILLTTITSSVLSLTLIIWQYSQISGLNAFLKALTNRYFLRSGLTSNTDFGLSYTTPLSWINLMVSYIWGYAAIFIITFILLSFYLIYKFQIKEKIKIEKQEMLIFYIILSPILLHHFLLFNFTVIHDFALLKDSIFIAIFTALIYHRLISLNLKSYTKLAFWITNLLVVLCIIASIFTYVQSASYNVNFKNTGQRIRTTAKNDEVIFLKTPNKFHLSPPLIFYAHRNIAMWENEAAARELMAKDQAARGIIFTLDQDIKITKIEYLEK